MSSYHCRSPVGYAPPRFPRPSGNATLVARFTSDPETAEVGDSDRALHAFAVKLTREPWRITRDDVDALRAQGFNDVQLSDAVQVISYFNYINRVADGLGVDLEDFMSPDAGE